MPDRSRSLLMYDIDHFGNEAPHLRLMAICGRAPPAQLSSAQLGLASGSAELRFLPRAPGGTGVSCNLQPLACFCWLLVSILAAGFLNFEVFVK